MRILILILAISSLLLAKSDFLPEATVAVVNGVAISEDDLRNEMHTLMPESYYHGTVTEEKKKLIEEKAMKSLVKKALFYKYAIDEKLVASDEDVEEALKKMEEAIKKKLEGVKDARELIIKVYKNKGVSFEELKRAIKKEITLNNLHKAKIEKILTEEDLKKYYEKNKYKFKEPAKIELSLINVKNDPLDPKGDAKAKQKIEEALEKIKKGEDFGAVAAKYSNDMSRIKGGEMGFLHKGLLDPYVEKKAFALKIGELSDIIETDLGYYIVKVTNKKDTKQLSFEEVKTSLKKDLKKKEEDKRISELYEELRSKAKIVE